jgi:hypothetical protein
VCWELFKTSRFSGNVESRITSILILGPVTLTYLVAFIKYVLVPFIKTVLVPFIKYVVANPAALQPPLMLMWPKIMGSYPQVTDKDETWHWLAYLAIYLVVIGYCFFLINMVFEFSYYGPKSWTEERLKLWLGAIQTAAGGLIAIVFEQLFGVSKTQSPCRE